MIIDLDDNGFRTTGIVVVVVVSGIVVSTTGSKGKAADGSDLPPQLATIKPHAINPTVASLVFLILIILHLP